MQQGWRAPRRWARTGGWLLVPTLVLDWIALLPQTVFVVAFVIAVLGLLGIAAAIVVSMVRRSRVGAVVLGLVLLLAGLALLGLNPFPSAVAGLDSWWPAAITQPQLVGSAYWTLLALGVVLAGVGLLGTLLAIAVTRGNRSAAR